MKKETISKVCTTVKIEFNNNVKLIYETIDGVLDKYQFFFKDRKYTYLNKETLEVFTKTSFSDHHKIIVPKINSIEELEEFNSFEDLYYIGYSIDGMIFKLDGTAISTPVQLDFIHFQVYEKLETTKNKCEKFLSSLNEKYITQHTIAEIPRICQDEDKKDHYTIELTVNIPQDDYNKIILDSNKTSVDSVVRSKIVEFLKSSKKEVVAA